MKEQQQEVADKFAILTGIYASYCETCDMWIVHCPYCHHNWCGGDCGCGYAMVMNSKQAQLDQMLLKLEDEK
jgi:hypothetical protein